MFMSVDMLEQTGASYWGSTFSDEKVPLPSIWPDGLIRQRLLNVTQIIG